MINISRSDKSKEAPLNQLREKYSKLVSELTTAARGKVLSQMSNQDLVYQEKTTQAKLFLEQAVAPTQEEGYEFIFAEVGVTADSPAEVAEIILSKAAEYNKGIGPAIERLRLIANKGVKYARSQKDLQECIDEFEEDLGLL